MNRIRPRFLAELGLKACSFGLTVVTVVWNFYKNVFDFVKKMSLATRKKSIVFLSQWKKKKKKKKKKKSSRRKKKALPQPREKSNGWPFCTFLSLVDSSCQLGDSLHDRTIYSKRNCIQCTHYDTITSLQRRCNVVTGTTPYDYWVILKFISSMQSIN